MGHAKEPAYSLPYILMNPSAVFEGIRRDEDEAHSSEGIGWLCYVGVPRCGYRPDGNEVEPWPDQVFLCLCER